LSSEKLYPRDPAALTQLGRSAADLLAPGPEWILRRKEKVTLLDDTAVRRQMSVDYLLPEALESLGTAGGEPVYYAPLFFLPKGMDRRYDPKQAPQAPEPLFANFDLRDETGRALSLPPRHWNGLLTTTFLIALIESTLADLGLAVTSAQQLGIAEIARLICLSEGRLADVRLDELRSSSGTSDETRALQLVAEADRESPYLARMLEICAGASVAMTPLIGERARQGIVKLSYDEEVEEVQTRKRLRPPFAALSWAGYELWVETPYIGAASYHFEFEAPAGLEIYDAGLLRIDGPEPKRPEPNDDAILDACSGTMSRLHLYERTATGALKTLAWTRLRVDRGEFVAGATVAGIFVAVAMWAAFILSHAAKGSPNSVPTILLLVPSVIAAYAVRPSAHRLTGRLLRGARAVVVMSAALPFIGAAALALTKHAAGQLVSDTFRWVWLGCAVAATFLALVLLGSRVFPVPDRAQQTIKKRLQRHLALEFSDLPAPLPRPPWIRRWRQGRLGRALARVDRWRKSA
jgi:hypothetical protein